MNYPDNRKGIFVFSDAAGANSILAIIDVLIFNAKKPDIDFLVFSDSIGKFDSDKYDFVIKLDFESKKVHQIIEDFSPDYIYTATSFHDYEHNWRKISSDKNIYTYAFIDHWIYYKRRFTFNGLTTFPNEVLVVNEIAKKEAIFEGIPTEIIKVFGNPYYKKVKNYKPTQNLNSFKKNIGIYNDNKIITFVSENIKDDIPNDSKGKSILGFDEYESLDYFLKALKKISKLNPSVSKLNIVIKIHPISQLNKFEFILKKYDEIFKNILVIKKFDALLLTYHSDFIFGMFSNMLIEALLFEKNVYRIQINQKIDLFKFDEIECKSIVSFKELNEKLNKIL